MKKFVFILIIVLALTPAAYAAETAGVSAAQEVPAVQEAPADIYTKICQQLSNGKPEIQNTLNATVVGYKSQPDSNILQALGAKSAELYAGDIRLGMVNFCDKCLGNYDTIEKQAKALAAFVRGYKVYGAVLLSFSGCESAPVTKEKIYKGTHAWAIPFPTGKDFKLNILGKPGGTARLWKFIPEKAAYKEWQGGNWEREITVLGK